MTTDREDVPGPWRRLTRQDWIGVAKRTAKEFRDDNVQDWAASLTYYAVLSIFPGLIVLVSILGLLGQDAIGPMLGNIRSLTPGPVQQLIQTGLANVQRSQGTAGVFAIGGLLLALWAASGYIGAFIRASNAIFDIREGRPFWKVTPLRVGLTLLLVILMAASAVAVTLTGRLAEIAGNLLGLGPVAVAAWNIAKWPVLVILATAMITLLYYAAPNVRQPGIRWLSPGSLLAVVLWLIVSAGFALYVARFGSYNKTYGTLAAVVVFLIWLWLSNMVVLAGAELDAELQRGRRIAEGEPAAEPYVEPRDPPKDDTADAGLEEAAPGDEDAGRRSGGVEEAGKGAPARGT
ncbi:YihY/virulence factor BrkB family protein [Microbispora corallina]|uniref:Ribonuclease n=1 Tax=Microbispora corallina TaxID=83302 RepID=A0ABQ4FUG3_9ACTN|nr:YihY/virulence factor BrkB family protein [Microbispora corallina]GIH38458.1 ribonuclease [Microbispora corallina]